MTRMFAALGALLLVFQLVWWLPTRATNPNPADAGVYYRAAQHVKADVPVYGDCPRVRHDLPPGGFFYPPTVLTLLRPFGGVSATAFQIGFFGVLLVAFWLFIAGLVHLGRPLLVGREAFIAIAATGMLVELTGISAALMLGNADVIVWALVAWAFAERKLAGSFLVIGAALKIYPVFVLIGWWSTMTERERRDAKATAVAVVLLTAITVPWHYGTEFITVGLPELAHGYFVLGNVSVTTWMLRLFVTDMTAPLPHWMCSAFSFAPLGAVGYMLYRFRRHDRLTRGAAILVVSVWTASICWWWRLAFALLIPVALWVRKRKETSCGTSS